MRYLMTLAATFWTAFAPITTTGINAWAASSSLSLLFIFFMWNFSNIRERDIIMYIELSAMSWAAVAFIELHIPKLAAFLSLESQWFWLNYGHIMKACFLMQIAVIIMGMYRSGELKRILYLCVSRSNNDKLNYSNLFRHQGFLCTKTQKTYRAL